MRKDILLALVLVASLDMTNACCATEIPTATQVGPAAMPAEIAPVDPLFEMPQPRQPQFARRRVTIDEFGADPGSDELVTKFIQQAIDETSAAGGGTVEIPPGEWHTGRIVLKSGVNLHLAPQAELHFSGQIGDYLPVVFARYEGIEAMTLGGLIYAHDQSDIAVTGDGKLIGPPSGPVRAALPGLSDKVIDFQLPVSERIFDGEEGRHYFRPYFICLVDCQRVLLEGITLQHGPMWNVVPIYCQDVTIRGVSVDSRGVVNGDGVNIESSRNVLVEYCQMNTGDDCYALKAGRDADGLRVSQPVENVVLRHCYATGGIGGLTCGSETAGGIRHVYVHDCVFENVRHAVYMKTRRPRGGGVEQVRIERVRFTANNHAVFFDMIGSPLYVGELGNRLPRRERTSTTPFYRSIEMFRLEGTCPRGCVVKIKGIPESPVQNLLFEDCQISGLDLPNLTDASNVTIRASNFETKNQKLVLLDVMDALFSDTQFTCEAGSPVIDVRGPHSEGIRFAGCTPAIQHEDVNLAKDVAAGAVTLQE